MKTRRDFLKIIGATGVVAATIPISGAAETVKSAEFLEAVSMVKNFDGPAGLMFFKQVVEREPTEQELKNDHKLLMELAEYNGSKIRYAVRYADFEIQSVPMITGEKVEDQVASVMEREGFRGWILEHDMKAMKFVQKTDLPFQLSVQK